MISLNRLIRMARKWQNLAALRRKRITLPRDPDGGRSGAAIVDKGCFVVYTFDRIRFVLPLDYLKNEIFQELLEMAEEEYGLQSDGPIRLHIKANYMQFTLSQIEKQMSTDLQKELFMDITSGKCLSTSNLQFQKIQTQLLVC